MTTRPAVTTRAEGDDAPEARRGAVLTGRRCSVALFLAVVALLGFAPATVLAAHLAPLAPAYRRAELTPAERGAPRAVVRELPVGLPAGSHPRTPADLDAVARLALGPGGAEHLRLLLGGDRNLPSEDGTRLGEPAYPNHYPEVDRLLDAAPEHARTKAAGGLGADLVVLASQVSSGKNGGAAHPSAAAVAYALLLRSRQVVGCDAEVDLLLLLAADNQPHDDVVRAQGRTADAACPDDPTPGWVLAQYLAQRARLATLPDLREAEKAIAPDAFARAREAATELRSRFPGSPDVRTAVGDVHLRAGQELGPSQPFTGRAELREALAAYEDAYTLGGGRAALVGQARALLGLDRAIDAVSVVRRVIDTPGSTFDGPGLEVLLQAEESAHDFSAAAGTARTLAHSAQAGFPASGPLVPREDALSLRFDTSVALDVVLAPCCGGAGGGDVEDVSFLPRYRATPGLIAHVPTTCAAFVERRDQLLAGQSEQAEHDFPEDFPSVRPDRAYACDLLDPSLLRAVVGADADADGSALPIDPGDRDQVLDARQNLFRWAGDLERAATATIGWDQLTGSGRYLPVERLGEIRYLQGRYDDAAALFDEALRRAQNGFQIDLDQARTRLARGTALLAAGRHDEGTAELRTLVADVDWVEARFRLGTGTAADADVAHDYAVVSYYARVQLGDAERRTGQPAAAVEDYDAARARLPLTDPHDATVHQVFPAVLLNAEALALMDVGRPQEALTDALSAVAEDPRNPVFELTAGSAAQQDGDVAAADRHDTAALELDPATFPAANNLGVALVAEGRGNDAATAFRRAVGARADYATGWFNLGVLDSRGGPQHLLQAQGALARAYALDPTLRDHPRSLVVDQHVYRTGVDASKPLPAGWSFTAGDRRQPAAALGLLAALGLVVASSSAAGADTGLLRRWIETTAATLARLTLLRHRRHLAWAATATVVTFGLAALWSGSDGAAAIVAYLLGVCLLTAVIVLARQRVGEHLRVRLVHRTWPPALLAGLATGAVGLPWAPLPYVRAPFKAGRIHLVAPIGLAVVTVVLLLEWVLWSTPLTHRLAITAATMTASLLLPVGPLDGSAIARRGQLVVGLGAAAALLLLLLGLD